MYFNIAKYIYDKATVNITIKSEELKVLSKIRNKTTVPFSPLLLYIVNTGSPSQSNWTTKSIKKGIQIRRKEVKLSLFADNTQCYIEEPWDLHQLTMLARMRVKGILGHCWSVALWGSHCRETFTEVPQRTKIELLYEYISEENKKTILKRYMYLQFTQRIITVRIQKW